MAKTPGAKRQTKPAAPDAPQNAEAVPDQDAVAVENAPETPPTLPETAQEGDAGPMGATEAQPQEDAPEANSGDAGVNQSEETPSSETDDAFGPSNTAGEFPINHLRAGGHARRAGWLTGAHIRIEDRGGRTGVNPTIVLCVDRRRGYQEWRPKDLSDMLADDWEEVPAL